MNHLRELAIKALLEGTSSDRISRAIKSKTRPAMESMKLEIGTLVDFWRAPVHKDESGWIGPGKVVHLESDSGTVYVKCQGHIYMCSNRHARQALTCSLSRDSPRFKPKSCGTLLLSAELKGSSRMRGPQALLAKDFGSILNALCIPLKLVRFII